MCGIVGYVTAEKHAAGMQKRDSFMEQGLIIDVLRGEDSTGIMFGKKEHSVAGWLKSSLPGHQFVRTKNYDQVEKDSYSYWFMVGHNRAATLGSISNDNAHPFNHEGVVGLHNGTIRGNMDALPMSRTECKVDVDSHAVIMNIAQVAPGDVRKDILSQIDGAFMLVWYDQRDLSLNFARNNTRTFHIAQSYTQHSLFFASEAGQLQWLNQRNALGLKDVQFLEAGHHLKFYEGSLKPEVEKFELYTPPKYVAPPRGASGGEGWQSNTYTPRRPLNDPEDNRIVAGGAKRDVPGKLQEELLELELAVEDRLCMTPIESQPEKVLSRANQSRYVTGYIDSMGMNCMVHDVDAHVARMAMNRRWTVRPVGVMYSQPGKGEPVLICHLVTTIFGQTKRTLLEAPPPVAPTTSSTSSTSTPDSVKYGLVGPEGELYSQTAWMILTRPGCHKCGAALVTVEAERMFWDEDDNPYCGDCSDGMEGDEYAKAAQRDAEDIEAQEMFELYGHSYSGLIH